VLGEQVNFGEVDCDASSELAKFVSLLNVPSMASYQDGKLLIIVIGAKQDVRGRLERILRGESLD
jgi:thioredoxin-like negative regulator of GroEL